MSLPKRVKMFKMPNKTSHRWQDISQFLILLGILVCANIIGYFFYGRIDMTEDKRYTLSAASRKIVRNVDDVIYIQVLLEGQFPAGFKRLRDETEIMLRQLSKINPLIQYEFDDPSAGSAEEVKQRAQLLMESGVMPVNLKIYESGEKKEKLIFPYALVNLGSKRYVVNLLENESYGATPEENLNNSVGLLEYKLVSTIQKLTITEKPIIFFTKGRGELDSMETIDLERFLDPYYTLGRLDLDDVVEIKNDIDLLIIARPTQAFDDKAKFKLDQYIMNGGKVIMMLDKLLISLDSLKDKPQFIPPENDLNLDDLLFRYGVRMTPALVMDLECSRIPLATGGVIGNKPQVELFDWYYHPLVVPAQDHPATKNLDRVNLKFPTGIDTIQTKTPIKKTVLLQSSKYTRIHVPPSPVTFEILRLDMDPSKFNKEPRIMAVLLEGEFPSLYENRVTPNMLTGLERLGIEFKSQGLPTKIAVISDGGIGRNSVNRETQQYNPVGFNIFENYRFANREFLLNLIEYMLDEKGILEARSREVKLRLLDVVRAQEEKTFWQSLNIGLPLILLGILAWVFQIWRKRRYAA